MLQPRRRRRQAEQERRRVHQRQRRHRPVRRRRRDVRGVGRLQAKNGQPEPMTGKQEKPENHRKPIFYEEGFTQIQILFTMSSARRCCIVFRVCFVIFVTVKIQH